MIYNFDLPIEIYDIDSQLKAHVEHFIHLFYKTVYRLKSFLQ